jgi:hypothetical protein
VAINGYNELAKCLKKQEGVKLIKEGRQQEKT